MAARQRRSAEQRGSAGSIAGRGRPRDEGRRKAVVQATRELLIASGYDEVSLSAVARLAGVSRPFVYDNWGTRFALVEDAIFTAPDQVSLVDNDKPFADAFGDLIATVVGVMSDPAYLAGLPGLAAELYNRPDLVDALECKYMAPVRSVFVRVVERGKAEGAVTAHADGSALLDTIRGAVMMHTLVNPAVGGVALIEHLRATLLHGIMIRS